MMGGEFTFTRYEGPTEIVFHLDDKRGRLYLTAEGKIAFDGDLDATATALFAYIMKNAPRIRDAILAREAGEP